MLCLHILLEICVYFFSLERLHSIIHAYLCVRNEWWLKRKDEREKERNDDHEKKKMRTKGKTNIDLKHFVIFFLQENLSWESLAVSHMDGCLLLSLFEDSHFYGEKLSILMKIIMNESYVRICLQKLNESFHYELCGIIIVVIILEYAY